MDLPLSGSKDIELIKIITEEVQILIKGKPVHPTVNQLNLHRDSHGEWEKALLEIVSFKGPFKAFVFDPFTDEQTHLSEYNPGKLCFPFFYEQQTYSLIIKSLKDDKIIFYHENKSLREAITPFDDNIFSGNLNFKNDIGFSELHFNTINGPIIKIKLEVFPAKIDYRRDFAELLKDVNEEIYNLAFDFIKRTYFNAKTIPTNNQSLSEFFSIINMIFEKLDKALQRININPHHKMYKVDTVNCIEKIKRFDHQSIKWLSRNQETLVKADERGIKVGTNNYMPKRLQESKKELTYDTYENRFIKWVLKTISNRLNRFYNEYTKLYSQDHSRFDQAIESKAKWMLGRIRQLSNMEFLKEVSNLHRLDNLSLVLQMDPGYRDVYRYYIMLLKGLSIQSDIYHLSYKDLSVLYEYWCFLGINKILKKKYKLKKNSLIKVNGKGLVVTLQKDKRADIQYINPQNGEIFKLSYQDRSKTPTIGQVPDNVLTLQKEGSEVEYKYVFDAKYRVNSALDKRYFNIYGKPGPEEDDINTMHRYRDAIVYEYKDNRYEKAVYGAFVLFPYGNEKLYSGEGDGLPHKFYDSISKINLGGLPFLPGHTKLVEKVLDDLILDSPETTIEKAMFYKGTEQYYYEKFYKKNVFIGSLKNKEQWDTNNKFNFYHTPLKNVSDVLGNLEYIAVYRSKDLFGMDNGIKNYGRIKSISILARKDISEIPSTRKDLYVRFEIEEWKELKNKIIPLQYGIYDRMLTSFQLLMSARELPELTLKNETEVRLWKELRRIIPGPQVNADDEKLDSANFCGISGEWGIIDISQNKLVAKSDLAIREWDLEDIHNNRLKVFKELREFVHSD